MNIVKEFSGDDRSLSPHTETLAEKLEPAKHDHDTSEHHVSVLRNIAIKQLRPLEGIFCDATFGRGGYTQAILKAPSVTKVIAFDRDPCAISFGQDAFKNDIASGRLQLIHDCFSSLKKYIPKESLDGIVFDFGLSSPQIDVAARGFSFMKEGPLDMGMGLNQRRASDLVNKGTLSEIAKVLFTFGGERRAKMLATHIVRHREKEPFQTTKQLANLCEKVLPRIYKQAKGPHHTATHPATRAFQALRIWVNEEIAEIETTLPQARDALKTHGRFVAISFHELEDRLIKHFLRPPVQSAGFFKGMLHPETKERTSDFICPVGQPIRPDAPEIEKNPRARSAKLRFGQKKTLRKQQSQ